MAWFEPQNFPTEGWDAFGWFVTIGSASFVIVVSAVVAGILVVGVRLYRRVSAAARILGMTR